MRRIGAAFLVLGVLRMVRGPVSALLAEEYLVLDGLAIRSTVEPPYLELLGGALILILAEIFRVGAELERRDATA
jgi:hypothetical protein